MREKQHLQATLFDHYVEHEIGYELKANSMILEQPPEFLHDGINIDMDLRGSVENQS